MPEAKDDPGLAQRFDRLALRKPKKVRRGMWFYGVLGVWAAGGTISSLAVQHWGIAAITFATFVGSAFMWWASRRALRRIPDTAQWVEGQTG